MDDVDEYEDAEDDVVRRLAEGGDAVAQYELGRRLCFTDERREHRTALAWWWRAARSGLEDAWYSLSSNAEDGRNDWYEPDLERALRIALRGWHRFGHATLCTRAAQVLQDLGRDEEAVDLLRTAAEAGDPDAMTSYGVALRQGRGVETDFDAMIRWYIRAARRGCPWAMHNLGVCRRYGEGTRRSLRKARWWFLRAARNGHPSAAIRAGELWVEDGPSDLARDPSRFRAELAQLAREDGVTEAAAVLGGFLLDEAPDDERDAEAGLRWLRWGVERGSSRALERLLLAMNVDLDDDEHLRLLRLGVEWELSDAMFLLGDLYDEGELVEPDPDEALRLFVRAAELGHASGAARAARRLWRKGDRDSLVRAFELLEGVVDDDDPEALRLLAACFEHGRGCEADVDEAQRWRARADEIETAFGAQLSIGRAAADEDRSAPTPDPNG